MSYHIVNIDNPRGSLFCKHGQLMVDGQEGHPPKTLPLEDIAAILITSFSTTLHSHLLLEAAKRGVILVICERFEPISLLLPVNRNTDTLLAKATVELPKKTRETLWRKTVDAKCTHQARLAEHLASDHPKLESLQKTALRAGTDKESTCARYYWQVFSAATGQEDFKRERHGGGLNDLLNFGYAVLLSQVLQMLLAVGLDPTFGISHEIRERATPLAYDLMEPFRPCVDARIAEWLSPEGSTRRPVTVDLPFRRYVTGFLAQRVNYRGRQMELRACIEAVVRSFRKAVLSKHTRDYQSWHGSP